MFVDAPLSVVESRDPKGLYKKAREGIIKGESLWAEKLLWIVWARMGRRPELWIREERRTVVIS